MRLPSDRAGDRKGAVLQKDPWYRLHGTAAQGRAIQAINDAKFRNE